MRLAICACLWCICVLRSSGQQTTTCNWSLSGVILDEHDNASLGYATLYVRELERGVEADSAGYFIIPNLCEGTYTLAINHIGCAPVNEVVHIKGNTTITFHLEHHAELLSTVELHAERLRGSVSTMSADLTRERILSSGAHSLGEVLSQLPGVAALQTGPTVFKPIIQGLHSDRLLILKDGLVLQSQQWGLDHAPEIDPDDAARISVVKGAAAVQYGTNAMGGVILVDSPDLPDTLGSAGELFVGAVDNGRQALLSGSLTHGFHRHLGMRAHGSFRRAGDAKAPGYSLTNTGVAEASFGLTGGYQKGLRKVNLGYEAFYTDIGILRSAHIGNLTDLLDALTRERPLVIEDFSYAIDNPRQRVLHQTLRLSGQTFLPKAGLLAVQYAVQFNNREEYDIRRGGRSDRPALDLQLITQSAQVSLAHEPLGGFRGKVGVQWSYQRNTNQPGTGVRPLIPNYAQAVPAVFVVEKYATDQVEYEAGIRYEITILDVRRIDVQGQLVRSDFLFHNYAATAGLRWEPQPDLAILTHLGFTRRSPQVNALFSEGLHHGAAAIEEGNPDLRSEQSLKWTTGLNWTRKELRVSATVFAQSIQDFIYLEPTGTPRLTIRGAFPVFQYTQDDAMLYGGDLSLQWHLFKDWTLESALSILRAKNTTRRNDLPLMPSDRTRHTLTWQRERYHAGCTFQYVWKQTRLPEDTDYADAPEAYALVQVNAGFVLIPDKLDCNIIVRNALNTTYREYLNRLRYYADDLGRSIEFRLHYTL